MLLKLKEQKPIGVIFHEKYYLFQSVEDHFLLLSIYHNTADFNIRCKVETAFEQTTTRAFKIRHSKWLLGIR